MNQKYRIGVLGLTHDHVWDNLGPLCESSLGELVAAADPNPPLLEKIQQLHGCAIYQSHEEMVENERLDGVFVFSSNARGSELAVWAAEHQLHILVEKPMAATQEGADRMLAAAHEAGVRLMINWPFAWWPQLQQAITLALDGEIGDLWQLKYRAAHAGPEELGCSSYFCDWLFDEEQSGGGAMMDYCCYGTNLSRVLLGMPERVTGFRRQLCKTQIGVEDNAMIVMSYPRAMSIAEASWTQLGKLTSYTTAIYGTRGTLLVEPRQGGRLFEATAKEPEGIVVDVPNPPKHLSNSADHFLHGISTNEEFLPLCQSEICRDVQEILEAGLQSSRTGREICLPLLESTL